MVLEFKNEPVKQRFPVLDFLNSRVSSIKKDEIALPDCVKQWN